eukprot:3069292-Alexandrium_andersonii.AAC.1
MTQQQFEITFTDDEVMGLHRAVRRSKKRGLTVQYPGATLKALGLKSGDTLVPGGDLVDHISMPLRSQTTGNIR